MTHPVLCFGEMLIDELPGGDRPGGGPFNTAAHLATLGTPAAIVSALGEDLRADLLRSVAADQGVDTRVLQTSYLETGRVVVTLDRDGEPDYDIIAPVAWDLIRYPQPGERYADSAVNLLPAFAKNAPAVLCWMLGVRSEISHGSLGQVLAKAAPHCLKVADLGFRQNFHSPELLDWLLQRVTVAKLNSSELARVCLALELEHRPEVLAKAYHLDTLIVTAGARGATLYRDGETVCAASPAVEVVDTVGCGDAFLAGYVHARLRGSSDQQALDAACARGSYAATLSGGLP